MGIGSEGREHGQATLRLPRLLPVDDDHGHDLFAAGRAHLRDGVLHLVHELALALLQRLDLLGFALAHVQQRRSFRFHVGAPGFYVLLTSMSSRRMRARLITMSNDNATVT